MNTEVLTHYNQRVESYLNKALPKANPSFPDLANAMHYSVFNGGKRLRPALVYATTELLGAPLHIADPAAAAVELIHCFSLVHDDLPAMDNSDYRRGKLSCHKQFGEDTAILAGDALLNLAFELLAEDNSHNLSHKQLLTIIKLLSQATGTHGMIAGQIMDINNSDDRKISNKAYSLDKLKLLHQLKTGALIKSSVLVGAISADPQLNQTDFKRLRKFGETIGLLYQVCDDILDVIADRELLGKQAGTDKALGKTTYIDLLGLKETQAYAQTLVQHAHKLLENFAKPDSLNMLVELIGERAGN